MTTRNTAQSTSGTMGSHKTPNHPFQPRPRKCGWFAVNAVRAGAFASAPLSGTDAPTPAAVPLGRRVGASARRLCHGASSGRSHGPSRGWRRNALRQARLHARVRFNRRRVIGTRNQMARGRRWTPRI